MVAGFVEIEPLDRAEFLKVRETLTRIGLPGNNSDLYQICYVLHKRGRYYLVSYVELHRLDGKQIEFTETDRNNRDAVIALLVQWEGLGVRLKSKIEPNPETRVKVIHFSDKADWRLVPTYHIGKRD